MSYYEPQESMSGIFSYPAALWKMRDKGVTITEILLYSAIKRQLDTEKAEGRSRKDERGYYTNIRWSKFASVIHVAQVSIYELKERLMNDGLIYVVNRGTGSAERIYLVNPQEDA